jgi:hypothetical protein
MPLFLLEIIIGLPVLIVCAVLIARKVSKSLDSVDFEGEGTGKNYDY